MYAMELSEECRLQQILLCCNCKIIVTAVRMRMEKLTFGTSAVFLRSMPHVFEMLLWIFFIMNLVGSVSTVVV
jgi:hypothetical protein